MLFLLFQLFFRGKLLSTQVALKLKGSGEMVDQSLPFCGLSETSKAFDWPLVDDGRRTYCTIYQPSAQLAVVNDSKCAIDAI